MKAASSTSYHSLTFLLYLMYGISGLSGGFGGFGIVIPDEAYEGKTDMKVKIHNEKRL